MKIINPPIVDDIEELTLLSVNENLGSYPYLRNECSKIIDQYSSYIAQGGNPWGLNQLPVNSRLKKALITHYNNPPVERLEFIHEYRRNLSPILCPMCGGFGNGTLDHYLPKDDYPEYAFFSKNLVPACNCNSLRGTTVRGAASPQRVIHPYFDVFMRERLYQSKFLGSFETPSISIEVINHRHPQASLLQFHLDEVISNDATQGWFEKYWSDLNLRAHDILDLVLPTHENAITSTELMSSIKKYRNSKDKEYDTCNNWFSIFYTGLMNDKVRVSRLATMINEFRLK